MAGGTYIMGLCTASARDKRHKANGRLDWINRPAIVIQTAPKEHGTAKCIGTYDVKKTCRRLAGWSNTQEMAYES